MINKPENRLALEKSPYLRQHAYNPVDWYPWGPEAFEKAKKENKPVFLSIGYSTCHWCHVMEKESFEDIAVAGMMNEAFVSIKVDREERPDIDAQYMAVCQLLTQSGGWPLTIIMTHDKRPFYAGTYFPRETRFGRIGMMDLIPRINQIWKNNPEEVLKTADQITAALHESTISQPGNEPGENELHSAFTELSARFDDRHGGFGTAPKFPTPHNLLFLLRYWNRTENRRALAMVEQTLQSMRRGGIYDHVGYGFHRYSTDEKWLLPHFEKMLFDQAQLAIAYLEAFQATGKVEYAQTAREIFTYCLRDMKSPEGGFYSAEDADSEGLEGKFYLWKYDEIRKVLPADEAALFAALFNISKNGNINDPHGSIDAGLNIPYLTAESCNPAKESGLSHEEITKKMESIRQKLFTSREKRIHPMKDLKVLTDWNGLMIAALAIGARTLDDSEYAEAAKRAADFILNKMKTAEGRLLHRYFDGDTGLAATLDDYAFLVYGLLELYETTFDVSYLEKAIDLNRQMIGHFRDADGGGFYLTADDAEPLLVRQKESYDGAIPSGNSIAMLNLLRLGRIAADAELEQMAGSIAGAFSHYLKRQPASFTQMLTALDFAIGPSHEISVCGQLQAIDTMEMFKAINHSFIPNKVVIFVPANSDPSRLLSIAKYAGQQTGIGRKATGYVCSHHACHPPTTDIGEMLKLLGAGQGKTI